MSSPPPNATITTYRNPVLPGWNAHPSVCNVPGKGYFVATSSASLVPAVPVYHSTDLFTWELVGHAIHGVPDYGKEGNGSRPQPPDSTLSPRAVKRTNGIFAESSVEPAGSRPLSRSRNYDTNLGGFWTPSLRYFGGRWYAVVVHETEDGEPRLVVTSTRDIFDTTSWSTPIVLSVRGRDPDLFFDAGKAYLSYSLKLCPESDPKVYVCPIDLESGKPMADPTLLYSGPHTGMRLLRCAGWYYLFVDGDVNDAGGSTDNGKTAGTSGGVELTACTRVFRTKTPPAAGGFLDGYESAPHNPVLYNANHPDVRGTSRLSLVRGERGWSALFHGTRGHATTEASSKFTPLPVGLETYMAGVSWVDGWPVINAGNPIGTYNEAEGMRWLPEVNEFEDAFDGHISYAWSSSSAVVQTENSLTLQPDGAGECALYLRQPTLSLDFAANLDTSQLSDDATAGVTVRVGDKWARLGIRGDNIVHEMAGQVPKSFPLTSSSADRRLHITCRPDYYELGVVGSDVEGSAMRVHLPPPTNGVGAHIGLFSTRPARFLRAGWKRLEAEEHE